MHQTRGGGGGGYSWEFLVGVCYLVFQTKKWNFPHPFSDQISKIHTHFQSCPLGRNYVIITLERKQKSHSNPFGIRLFLFFLTHLELKRQIRSYTPYFPLKPPFSDQNGQSIYPFSDQNGAKTLPFGAAHTYMAYIREYRPTRTKHFFFSYQTHCDVCPMSHWVVSTSGKLELKTRYFR